MTDADGGPFYTNTTFALDELEQRLADAVAHYRLPAPWGCLFGWLASRRRRTERSS